MVLGLVPAIAADSADARIIEQARARRGSALLWIQDGHPTGQARALTAALRDASRFGLNPQDYQARDLTRQLQALLVSTGSRAAEHKAFDDQLSVALLALLNDLHFGRIDPRTAGFDMPVRRDGLDRAGMLDELAGAVDTDAVLAKAEPAYEHYRLLRAALIRYQQLAALPAASPLPPLRAGPIHAGQPYAGAPALRRLLAAMGILAADHAADANPIIDPGLSAALQRFQYLHGLREDGALGRETLSALQVPFAMRVRQIELTLERWRWLPALQPRTLIVNIPAFRLFLIRSPVDRESDMLRMNVIVGHEYAQRRTPVFSADMDAVIFRPYWDVPASITRRELLPQLQHNPLLLEQQHMELVTNDARALPQPLNPQSLAALGAGQLRLRQQPGADNALGLIKFVLPNRYDVYLHSTPSQRLFAEPRRAFSHGCVRVSEPAALAAAVLEGAAGDWTEQKVRAAMEGDATFRVPLAHPVHVLIVYGTAIASEDGAVHFFNDLYGFDARLERLLRATSDARAIRRAH